MLCCYVLRVIKALTCIAQYLPHKTFPRPSCSGVDFLPAGAIKAVEDRIGEVVSIRLGRNPPGEFDEACGDEGSHEITWG